MLLQRELLWWHEVCKQPFLYNKVGVISIIKSSYFRTNGITFPTLSDPTGLAVVSFVFNEKNCLYTQLKSEILNDLELLSREFHRHVIYRNYQESIFTKPLLKRFSDTEDKVFKKLLLSGESANYIASEIGISAKGVENAIRRLRVKLAGETPEGLPRISKNNLIRYGSLMGVENWLR